MASLAEQVEIAEALAERLAEDARQKWVTYIVANRAHLKADADLRELRRRQRELLIAAGLAPADVPTVAMPVMEAGTGRTHEEEFGEPVPVDRGMEIPAAGREVKRLHGERLAAIAQQQLAEEAGTDA